MKARLVGLVLIVTVALIAGSGGSASAHHLHPCGDLDSNRFDIVANFKCSNAKRVVRNLECSGNCGDDDFFSGKFDCQVNDKGIELARIKCKYRDKQVRWTTGA